MLSLDENGRVRPTRLMANYNCWVTTESDIFVKDPEALKAEIKLLNELLEDIHIGSEPGDGLNIHFEDNNRIWVGGYDASLSLQSCDLDDILKRVPPEEWTEREKFGHAEAFGYPTWLPEIATGDELDVVGFLQRHITDETVGVITGAGHEALRYVDGWVCVFTKDQCEFETLGETSKRLERTIKQKQQVKEYKDDGVDREG